MRYGIISDVHSNLEALKAALDYLQDVDALFCVGDVVGYGPNPNECCDLIRERSTMSVLGNHDAAAIGRMPLDWFNPLARIAIRWTAGQLSDVSRGYLETLALVYRSEEFIMVHGSLSSPQCFEYITSPWEARNTLHEMDEHTVCFIGHTHAAEYYWRQIGRFTAHTADMAFGGVIELKPDCRYVINCGSVGQPRDGNPKASAVIFDTEARTVEIHRLEYPLDITQRKMRDIGLPEPLRQRLESGT